MTVSILTTGFVSETLSYDFDTDPKRRAFNPEFYGEEQSDEVERSEAVEKTEKRNGVDTISGTAWNTVKLE